ncbi:MAG: DUF1549 and DUF1553 domain-containing protein, partial [Lentisphaerales bacterium]|nr:DUF1549 and DUF1553 domain-containing protein [Lentisphaerales bacterium]
DSNGYQHDQRRTVWPYRDWVIKALNDNMPFDQFTIEQVAGDLLPNPTRKQLLATGFNRCGTVNLAGGSKPEETRYDLAKDRVNTIGTVYLGATLECAQCHNHKYDPISQEEYYKLLAYFRPAADRTYALSGRGTKKRVFGGELILDNYPIDQPDHDEFSQEILSHAAETVKTKRLSDLIIQGRLKKDPEMDYVKISKKLNKKADMLVGQYDQNAPYRAWIMQDVAMPDKTYILKRGSYLTPGEEVQAGTPEVLHAIDGERSSNRLELARWLIDRENPLTARVMVNRFWNELFGRGIVTTTEDFGYQGALPSHPQLLDWLAAEFMKDWSIKGILKTIVLSSTYRQGSAKGQALNIDPENIYLSSGPRNRLSAEMIRDNLLGISGLLSAKMGGVPVYPPQPKGLWDEILDNHDKVYPTSTGEDVYRRSVYVIWRRGSLFPGFSIFDAPARNACVSHRTRTNSPLQALVTMNEPVLVEAAVALAHKIKDYSGSLDEKIIWAFRKCLARAPQAEELDILKKLYEENKITASEVVTKDKTGANKYEENDFLLSASSEVVPWFYVAHTLMNLDEVIRKR